MSYQSKTLNNTSNDYLFLLTYEGLHLVLKESEFHRKTSTSIVVEGYSFTTQAVKVVQFKQKLAIDKYGF